MMAHVDSDTKNKIPYYQNSNTQYILNIFHLDFDSSSMYKKLLFKNCITLHLYWLKIEVKPIRTTSDSRFI